MILFALRMKAKSQQPPTRINRIEFGFFPISLNIQHNEYQRFFSLFPIDFQIEYEPLVPFLLLEKIVVPRPYENLKRLNFIYIEFRKAYLFSECLVIRPIILEQMSRLSKRSGDN